MSDPTNLPRVYGEREIGQILKRATELQQQEPMAPGAAGVTLTELEEIAAEAGIDPTYLRRAALEIDSGITDGSFWAKVVGDDLILAREVTLPGELAPDGFERIVETIHASSRDHGQPSLLGRTLTWRAETSNKTRTIQLVVASRDGSTNIRLEENLTQAATGVFIGSTLGVGVGAGVGIGVPIGIEVLGSVLFAFAAPIGVAALAFIGARAAYRLMTDRRRRAMNELFDRTVEAARASIARTTLDGHAATALPSGE